MHAGVVEIFVGKHAKCRYSTIQNWSTNIINLVTKRALVEENGLMEWIDGNIGSKVTMKYPACILRGEGATGNSISIAYAKEGQQLANILTQEANSQDYVQQMKNRISFKICWWNNW